MFKFSNPQVGSPRVPDRPEERVRQSLVRKMIKELGFPKGLISIEKAIGPRRYDLVCYTREMQPLLLVECKAGVFSESALRQASGYNHVIEAPFICLAGSEALITYWYEAGQLASVPFLPSFKDLYEASKRL